MGPKIVLLVHDFAAYRRFAYVTDRLPVTIGRDRELAACLLEGDGRVLGLHTCIDLRGEELLVRDEGSTAGTVVDGKPLPSGAWVAIGPANRAHEIRVLDWTIAAVAATDDILKQVQESYELRGPASVISSYVSVSMPSANMSELGERLRELDETIGGTPPRRFDN